VAHSSSSLATLYNQALSDKEQKCVVKSDATGNEFDSEDEFFAMEPQCSGYQTLPSQAMQDAIAHRDAHLQRIGREVEDLIPQNRAGATSWHLAQTKGAGKDPIDRYRLERLDVRHTMGDYLVAAYQEFQGLVLKNMDFWKWVERASKDDVKVKEWNPALFKSCENQPKYAEQYINWFRAGVKYQNDEKTRDKYLVEVKGGQLFRKKKSENANRELFDTFELVEQFKSKHQGMTSAAIWVLSPADKFYSHLVKIGRFHHSSLLGGTVVKAAGEWGVKEGKIMWVNGKSGHYRPDTTLFIGAINSLNNDRAFAPDAKVRLYQGGSLTTQEPVDVFLRQVQADLNHYKTLGLEVFAS